LVGGSIKGDFEVFVPGVAGDFFDFGFSDMGPKGFFDVSDTIGNVVRRPLGNHLNGAIGQIADEAC